MKEKTPGEILLFFINNKINISKDWYYSLSGTYFKLEVWSMINPELRYAVRISYDELCYTSISNPDMVIVDMENRCLIQVYNKMKVDGFIESCYTYEKEKIIHWR